MSRAHSFSIVMLCLFLDSASASTSPQATRDEVMNMGTNTCNAPRTSSNPFILDEGDLEALDETSFIQTRLLLNRSHGMISDNTIFPGYTHNAGINLYVNA